jgi:hypothetical protein
MTPIQIILLASFALACVVSVALLLTRKLAPTIALTGIFVSVLACLAVVIPDATTDIANRLGIERGVNLLVYGLAVVVFFGFLSMYVRLRRVRSELTRLVREMALASAEPGPDPPAAADVMPDRGHGPNPGDPPDTSGSGAR